MKVGDAMANIINTRVPLCGLSVFVHSITLRKASPGSQKNYYQHQHPGFEIHCVTAGNCQVKCSSKIYGLDPNTVLLLPPEVYHNVTDTEKDTVHISICFSLDKPEDTKPGSKTDTFYRTFDQTAPLLLPSHDAEIRHILQKMEAHLQDSEDDPYRKEKLLTFFCEFLLELAGFMGKGKTAEPVAPVNESGEDIDFMIDNFLALNFMHNDAMPRIAEQLHVSTRQLHRIIKQHYGTNYRQKLSEIRLKIAMDMLCNTDMPIHKISEVLGYSSSANFSTFIKHYTQRTPSQIRKYNDLSPERMLSHGK